MDLFSQSLVMQKISFLLIASVAQRGVMIKIEMRTIYYVEQFKV